jgi:beta-galactosidase/beta-glucuronidase
MAKAVASVPRAEHPRPQLVRDEWINLNGTWTFALDFGKSGRQRGWSQCQGFDGRITVPFCPESKLSGVEHTDFIECMWYQRTIKVPKDWAGKNVLLHFGALDYECEVFVDGKSAGRHWGGSSSFTMDLTALVKPGGTHNLVVYVSDEARSGRQAGGKQSTQYASAGCSYTRVTGIWQTVWLEAVSPFSIIRVQVLPDLEGGRFAVVPTFRSLAAGQCFRATLIDDGRIVADATVPAANGSPCVLQTGETKAWSPESPFLYDLAMEVVDAAGAVLDRATGYAGLRKVHVQDGRVWLNNEPRYLRLVLDQGFYPDGIWTAPSDEALRRDIELSMAAGFNGARLHQKVFEERFHYWADRLGYLTWGESPSWGMGMWGGQGAGESAIASAWGFLSEWREILLRDRNHPSIIAWSPFNETRGGAEWPQHGRLHLDAYELTRGLDPTRPVNDSSGYVHYRTDLYTVHHYEQDVAKLKADLTPAADGSVWRNFPAVDAPWQGQPYIVDEFGGIKWIPPKRMPHSEISWGYGQGPRTLAEFYKRLEGMVQVLDNLPHCAGWCYTQLTDVEQEQNGVYCYDRTKKFDMARIRRIFRGESA